MIREINLCLVDTLCLDWAHNSHSVPFEQSKNAHFVPSLLGVLVCEAQIVWLWLLGSNWQTADAGVLYPIQTGHIMRILSPLNSQIMRIRCPVCQGIS